MSFGFLEIGLVILGLIGGAVLIGLAIIFSITIVKIIAKVFGHVFSTLFYWLGDIFRLVGALVVALVFIPLVVLNVLIGRWSASAHFGRALTDECKTMGTCLYRIAIGHPLALVGLRGMTEGIEQRLPAAVAHAPGADKPSTKRQGLFEGYTIVGSLPGGGSGGKLYVAEPDELKRAAYARRGHEHVEQVVIKTFSLDDGSSLPQIVRESRALDAAKKLGLVLEHDLAPERFYYIMRYVPGDSLTVATQQLHARSEPKGLDARGIQLAIGYTTDLLESLETYHQGGLWHKDVKPDNLIVDREIDPNLGRGRAHLVDFGLITPLRSAMTLTTHGTEYFRDPELVRQALRGVKVHQIDGGKFDVYAAGAVLFSIIENSFPAHGGLSQVSKNCPEAIRWVIRRAMTDYDKRYPTARAMLDDLQAVAAASDPFSVKPADLPSMNGQAPEHAPAGPVPIDPIGPIGPQPAAVHAAASPVPPPATPAANPAAFAATPAAAVPKVRIKDWWSGRYIPDDRSPEANPVTPMARPAGFDPRPQPRPRADVDAARGVGTRPLTPPDQRLSAKDQLKNAQRRAAERRARVGTHRPGRGHAALGPTAQAGGKYARRNKSKAPSAINAGIVMALLFVVSAIAAGVIVTTMSSTRSARSTTIITDDQGNTTVITESTTTPAPPQVPGQVLARADHANPAQSLVPAPGRPLEDLGIAFIYDFRPPFDHDTDADLDLFDKILKSHNIRMSSNLIVEYADEINHGDDMIAKLKKMRGMRTLGDELGDEIRQYIKDTPGLDTVWWTGPADGDKDSHNRQFLLVSDSTVSVFNSSDVSITEITEAFIDQAP